MKYTAVIVAAGSGSRMGLGFNKVYYEADGQTILERTVRVFLDDPDCAQIVVVTDAADYFAHISWRHPGRVMLAAGGKTRQQSVLNGLHASLCDTVFIHDGARPFLAAEQLADLRTAMETEEAACLMVPCKDTVQRVEDGYIAEALPRESLMAAQTPQAFRTDLIINCLEQAERDGYTGTDDCSAVLRYTDVRIKAITGSYANIKITTPEDLKEFR